MTICNIHKITLLIKLHSTSLRCTSAPPFIGSLLRELLLARQPSALVVFRSDGHSPFLGISMLSPQPKRCPLALRRCWFAFFLV